METAEQVRKCNPWYVAEHGVEAVAQELGLTTDRVWELVWEWEAQEEADDGN